MIQVLTSFMLRIGLYGLGTVGQGLIKLINDYNLPIKVIRVVDRSFKLKQNILAGVPASDKIEDLLNDNSIDVQVELIGGTADALYFAREVLDRNFELVTANKALLAEHGYPLFSKAALNKRKIGFEAAIAGAIPIVRSLLNFFPADKILQIEGILNGTSNYILTRMRTDFSSYQETLPIAQNLGLAEADPTLDVNGMDSVHKLALLATIITKQWCDYRRIPVSGINFLLPIDIKYANQMNYRIRLLARLSIEEGNLFAEVSPVLIPSEHLLWNIEWEQNAIQLTGEASGNHVLRGNGAGSLPTAFSVASDLMTLHKGNDFTPPTPWSYLEVNPFSEKKQPYYIRMILPDETGMTAQIASCFAEEKISIAAIHQDIDPDLRKINKVYQIILTHKTYGKSLKRAINAINKLKITEIQSLPIIDFSL